MTLSGYMFFAFVRLVRDRAVLLRWLVLMAIACPAVLVADEAKQVVGLPAGIQNSQDKRDIPDDAEDSLRRIEVPDGFQVSLFAAEPNVSQPIAFTFDDRGRLWVVECYSHPNWKPEGHDRVVVLEDSDQDGRFDKRTVFWDKGRYLTGIAWGHGGIYLCNTPELTFIPDRDFDLKPDGPPEAILDGWSRNGSNNVFNNLRFGPDGWLYGCIGQNHDSIVGAPDQSPSTRKRISRGLWRYHPYDREFEVVALGAVNPWGLDFNDHGQAFFSNCVLPHLWHVVPGAYYERRKGERDNPYVYQRMQPCCDHRHWAEGNWTDSRGGHGNHNDAGGGHAHTGAMIYLGGNWPDKYRDTYFVGNIHGNRINNDLLERQGSGYVARHGKDFLYGNSPWFRCLSQKYGPDGGVYITDWHDVGECHDNDGSHRSSGRIYKVVYGNSDSPPPVDLQASSSDELVDLQLHRNEWMVRHARRVLQERTEQGVDLQSQVVRLRSMFEEQTLDTKKLRALWCLYVMGATDEGWLRSLLNHESEHVRTWAVRLLVDRGSPSIATEKSLVALSESDGSGLVRLFLASALQRVSSPAKWAMVTRLAQHSEDAEDANIPLMLWYGIEPEVPRSPARAIRLIESSRIPLLRQFVTRRLTDGE